jgi:hypothetical protein
MIPVATNERRIVKVWRERAPAEWGWGRSMVWLLKWNDGKEEYTNDSASGRGMFTRKHELQMLREQLSPELLKELQHV